jgi:hypothetical protein
MKRIASQIQCVDNEALLVRLFAKSLWKNNHHDK